MNALRTYGSVLVLGAIAALAGCGGGGGGGSTTPPTSSSGGGPVSTSQPTSTPTPTPAPAASPTGAPVATGYAISAQTSSANGGFINGSQSWYRAGVTVPWTPQPGVTGQNGDTAGGATASSNFEPVDGIACASSTEPAASQQTYSVHAFVGIYYNGKEYALPQGIGMQNPTEPILSGHPNDDYEIESQQCEYNVHTHDYSGLVHIEDTGYPQSKSTTSPLSYKPTLQTLLHIWGVQLGSNGLTVPGGTNLSGPAAIYYGTQSSTDYGPHGGLVTDSYTQVASASDAPLAFHSTIWIVIGSMPTAPNGKVGLPEVEWRIQF
jgi:hypothetical protein